MFQIPDWTLIAFSTETWPHLQEKWFILIASGLKIDTWEIQMTVERTNFSISAKGLIIYWLWLLPHGGDHKVTISAEEMRNFRIFFRIISYIDQQKVILPHCTIFASVVCGSVHQYFIRLIAHSHALHRSIQKDIFQNLSNKLRPP